MRRNTFSNHKHQFGFLAPTFLALSTLNFIFTMADTATVKKQALLRLIRLKTSIARLHLDTFQEAVDDLSKEVEEANHTLKAGGTGDIEGKSATVKTVRMRADVDPLQKRQCPWWIWPPLRLEMAP